MNAIEQKNAARREAAKGMTRNLLIGLPSFVQRIIWDRVMEILLKPQDRHDVKSAEKYIDNRLDDWAKDPAIGRHYRRINKPKAA